MTQRHAKVQIRREEAGKTLADWLEQRFTYHSRDEWASLIGEGRVLRNGNAAQVDSVLAVDDLVEYHPLSLEEPTVDAEYSIVYEDNDLFAVNKPPNLPCHPGGKFFKHTLWFLLRSKYPGARIINRLDRETSGIVLVAKDKRAARLLGRQFERRQVQKEYLVLVEGQFPDTMQADGVLVSADSVVRKKRAFQRDGEGESCSTRFRCLERFDGMSLVHVELGTGRMHQIRASLCSLGFPVVGDKIYGVDERIFLRFVEQKLTDADRQMLRLPHQALHAHRLAFSNCDGDPVCVEAPLPDDFCPVIFASSEADFPGDKAIVRACATPKQFEDSSWPRGPRRWPPGSVR